MKSKLKKPSVLPREFKTARRRCVECSEAPWLPAGTTVCPDCGVELPTLANLAPDGGCAWEGPEADGYASIVNRPPDSSCFECRKGVLGKNSLGLCDDCARSRPEGYEDWLRTFTSQAGRVAVDELTKAQGDAS